MSRYQNVSQRASRFASGCAESFQTADSFAGGLSRIKTATIAPTASTAARLATNGTATAPSAALRVRWGTVCIVGARTRGSWLGIDRVETLTAVWQVLARANASYVA